MLNIGEIHSKTGMDSDVAETNHSFPGCFWIPCSQTGCILSFWVKMAGVIRRARLFASSQKKASFAGSCLGGREQSGWRGRGVVECTTALRSPRAPERDYTKRLGKNVRFVRFYPPPPPTTMRSKTPLLRLRRPSLSAGGQGEQRGLARPEPCTTDIISHSCYGLRKGFSKGVSQIIWEIRFFNGNDIQKLDRFGVPAILPEEAKRTRCRSRRQ